MMKKKFYCLFMYFLFVPMFFYGNNLKNNLLSPPDFLYPMDNVISINQIVGQKGVVLIKGNFVKPITTDSVKLSIKYKNALGVWMEIWCKNFDANEDFSGNISAIFELPTHTDSKHEIKIEIESNSTISNASSILWDKTISHYKYGDYTTTSCTDELEEAKYTVLLTPKKTGTVLTSGTNIVGVKDRVNSTHILNKKDDVVFSIHKTPTLVIDSNGATAIKIVNNGLASDILASTPEINYNSTLTRPTPYLYSYNDPVFVIAGKFSADGFLMKFSQWQGDVNGPGYHDFRNPNALISRYFNFYNYLDQKMSDLFTDQEAIVMVSSKRTGLRIYKQDGTYLQVTGNSNYNNGTYFGYPPDQGGGMRGPGSENFIISNTSQATIYGMGAIRNDQFGDNALPLSDIENEISKFINYVGIFGNNFNEGGSSCSTQCIKINAGANPDYVPTDWTKAPNSYIFTGKDNNGNDVDGLYIPVKKAYAMWKLGKYMGNANEVITGTQTPSVFWEDKSGLIKAVTLSSGATLEDATLKIEIDKSKGEGNAVVALHIGNTGTVADNVYWSWHVWVTDSPNNGAEYSTGTDYKIDGITPFVPKYMDRNLGATSNAFTGHEWAKSNGLYYQWGRKDPFPSLVNKDGTYYNIISLRNGIINNPYYPGNKIPKQIKPSSLINDNVRFSINNPLTFLERTNYSQGSLDAWFADSIYENNNTKYYNLWGDNYDGTPLLKSPGEVGFKGYQLKSSYDPCPCNFRIPSHNSSNATQSKFSTWGRDSSNNDDATDFKFNPNGSSTANNLFAGIKIYPALGVDFVGVAGRNMGKIPLTGKIYANSGSKTYPSNNFTDIASETNSWTASLGLNGARFNSIVNDFARTDKDPVFGAYEIYFSQISGLNTFGMTVRCIEDPNKELLGNFSTEFFTTNQVNFTDGINNPNSYVIANNQVSLNIPINKAFAMFNQYLSDHAMPVGNFTPVVVWTTNKLLIKKVAVSSHDASGNINVTFGTGNPKGNAIIALKDAQNKIIWSWHIWAPETTPTELNPYTTESVIPNATNLVNPTKSGLPPLTTIFMDRNLGALQAFPTISAAPTPAEIQQIKNSGGMFYQWGRKDPIPAFFNPVNPGGSPTTAGDDSYPVFLETGKDGNGNSVYNTTVAYGNHRLAPYSIPYSTYTNSSNANVVSTDPQHIKIQKVLKYSVENPFNLLYNSSFSTVSGNWQNNIDWISNQSNLFPERWGHGTKKSPFDPCPEGWRVPDVSFPYLMGNTNEAVKDGQFGSSPWYFGNILRGNSNPYSVGGVSVTTPRYGLNQSLGYLIGGASALKYEGYTALRNPENKKYGWVFNNALYNIGNIPATGYRALGNNPNMDKIGYNTALWTSSLGDQLSGRAVALEIIDANQTMSNLKTGIGIIPQAAIPCRCAKIGYDENGNEIGRYDPSAIQVPPNTTGKATNVIDSKKLSQMVNTEKLVVFPNPVKDNLYIKSSEIKDFYYQIYDASGKLILQGKFINNSADLSKLTSGIYLVRINNADEIFKIIKK